MSKSILVRAKQLYVHTRIHPKKGKEVPGRFLWTPVSGKSGDFDELVCNPTPTENLTPAICPPRTEESTLQAVGRLVEPSVAEAKQLLKAPISILSLRAVCDQYYKGCTCGTTYQNNCAHYLSNAFILAGYRDLLTSSLITARCPHKRPIRALDMLKWFKAKKTGFRGTRIQRNTGIWAVYQETSGWQHVVVIDTDRWLHYGTGDHWDWPVQWNYRIP